MRARVLTALCSCLAGISAAQADAIAPSYTVTDLGTAAGMLNANTANATVVATNGQSYAFPQTFAPTSIDRTANFPLADPAPTGFYGIPGQGYSFVQGPVYLYPNGIAIATNEYGFQANAGGSESWQSADVYYAQRNPDGSWGQPHVLVSAERNYGSGAGYWSNVSATLSKSGAVLENTQMIPGTQAIANDVSVYNISTHTPTDLSKLPVIVNNGYSNLLAPQIDDNGDVLVTAYHQSQTGQLTTNLLLLTPSGVTSDPLPMAAPEPGAWVVMALAMAGFAAHRIRERRRRS